VALCRRKMDWVTLCKLYSPAFSLQLKACSSAHLSETALFLRAAMLKNPEAREL
jgi:hypothetical protein